MINKLVGALFRTLCDESQIIIQKVYIYLVNFNINFHLIFIFIIKMI